LKGNKMSKKTSDRVAEDAGKAIGYILAVAVVVGIVIISCFPFYATYLAISARKKIKLILEKLTGLHHFWLSPDEKKRFKILCNMTVEANENKTKAIQYAENTGITKNQDGQYSVRSQKGKEVRQIINNSDELIENANREIEELQNKPFADWEKADECFRDSNASVCGLFGFIVALPICVLQIKNPAQYFGGNDFNYIAWWCAASLIGGLIYLIPKFLLSSPSRLYFEEPPLVDMSNVDSWNDIVLEDRKELKCEDLSLEHVPDEVLVDNQPIRGLRKFVSSALLILSTVYFALVIAIIIGLLLVPSKPGISNFYLNMIVGLVMLIPSIPVFYLGRRLGRRTVK
jgi:cation transport ATPase